MIQKEGKESKAFRLMHESDVYKKIIAKNKEIKDNSAFQKELRELKKKFPRPKTDKEFIKYWKKMDASPRPKGRKLLVYFKEWQDFCEKWGIEYLDLCRGVIRVKGPLQVGVRCDKQGRKIPYLEGIPGAVITQSDWRDYIPLVSYSHSHSYGSPKQGPAKRAERNQGMRDEFVLRRTQGEAAYDIITDLSARHNLSTDRVTYIVRTKKHI